MNPEDLISDNGPFWTGAARSVIGGLLKEAAQTKKTFLTLHDLLLLPEVDLKRLLESGRDAGFDVPGDLTDDGASP